MGSDEVKENRAREIRDRVEWLRQSLVESEIAPKPFVQILSPFRGRGDTIAACALDLEQNRAYLDRCLHDSIKRGEVPFAPHKVYPGALDDLNETERNLGIECGLSVMARVDKVIAYTDRGVSDGMRKEIAHAEELGIEVETRTIEMPLFDRLK